MKNKDIISAVIGSAFFAVPYLAFSTPLAPALAIGVAAFGAGELILSKDVIIKGYTKPLKKVIEDAIKQNKEILATSKKINDGEIQTYAYKINGTVNKIINTIKENPNKAEKLDTFFDYYLPMVLKILTKYDNIENQGLSSAEQKKFMTSAKKMLSEATLSFEKVLNNLYQAELIDADADMKVFNTMLKSDGIDNEEIEVKKKEKKDEQE